MDTPVLYVILLSMGFSIILLACLIKESWRIKPAEVKIQKLGIDLKVQNNILMVILGCVILGGSGYFLHRSDQEAIAQAEANIKHAEEKVKLAQETSEREMRVTKANYDTAIREVRDVMLKEYQIEMNLLFDQVERGDPLDITEFYQDTYIKCCVKSRSGLEQCAEGEDLAAGDKGISVVRRPPYGIKVIVERIRVQEQIEITASYTEPKHGEVHTWRGEMMLPTVDLKLYKSGR